MTAVAIDGEYFTIDGEANLPGTNLFDGTGSRGCC